MTKGELEIMERLDRDITNVGLAGLLTLLAYVCQAKADRLLECAQLTSRKYYWVYRKLEKMVERIED